LHLTTAALWRVGARGAMPLGRIQCVVFDLDDTLWSTAETLQKAHEDARRAEPLMLSN
jgi:hypothetical protein